MQIIKEYTYHAGNEDSRNSSRDIALSQVKRLVLEELDIYLELESQARTQSGHDAKDQIITLASGMLNAEVLEDAWDGKIYRLKAKITAHPQTVIQPVENIPPDSKKAKELNDLRKKAEEFFLEYERLYRDLQEGDAMIQNTDHAHASGLTAPGPAQVAIEAADATDLDACTQAIETNPRDAVAYYNRGTVYGKLGDFELAIKDFNKAIRLDPQYAEAYHNRGVAYYRLGHYLMALKNSNKAIEFNPQYAMAYYNRGIACFKLGSYLQSVKDISRAIDFNPQDSLSYFSRAVAYCVLGHYRLAVKDCNKAIDLNPQYAEAYYQRSVAYRKLEEDQKPAANAEII